jgi:hypothetical protein
MHFVRVFILVICITGTLCCIAQRKGAIILPSAKEKFELIKQNNRILSMPDSIFTLLGNYTDSIALPSGKQKDTLPILASKQEKKTAPLLKIQGNILYNFSYRSYSDTPFAQNGLMQHLVQTSLNFVIKDKYPVRLAISNRSSNSPYFRNITDVNFQFNRQQLLSNIKEGLKTKVVALANKDALLKVEEQYKNNVQKMQELQNWVNSPARVQELIEEKERSIQKRISALPSQLSLDNILPKSNIQDSLSNRVGELQKKAQDEAKQWVAKRTDSSLIEKFNAKKEELAKLQATVKEYEVRIKQLKKTAQDSITAIKRAISSLNNPSSLFAFMKKNGMAKGELTKAQRLLLSINQVGIGRGWVDYSELTVKNLSLTGVNIEMNPMPFYFAVAAGKVNYRFRDFIIKNTSLPDQSLYLARIGVGQKEKNNFILTFYNGKKSVLNYTIDNTPASVQKVIGISAEARMAINENNYILAEVAKSSFNNAGIPPPSSDLMRKAFNLKIRSNEAYSIKLFSQNPQTNTKFTGYYRKIGENFQSFNLYPININQDAWMAKLNQQLWKKRISLEAAIRKNDFESPIAAPSFNNKTIFKSIQASVRIPKYPFVSIGYYPSSQLSVSNNDVLIENQYNTLNAVVSHNYQLQHIGMNTNAVITKFYNSSNDSGFIYFNAASYTVNQSLILSQLTLQSSASLTEQEDLHLFSLEQLLSYQFKNKLTLSGSIKWNRANRAQTFFGSTAALSVPIKKVGVIQINYDKTYLPDFNRALMPVDMGRMSFYRAF